MNTLVVNILLSTLIFSLAYRWFLKPALPRLKSKTLLVPILLLRSLRHLGFLLATIMGLSACATAPDTKPIYDAYVVKFNASNPNIAHTLQRKDGYNINVREFGAAHKGKKPSIVMMHGFPDNQHLYDLLVVQLASSHHVVTFDFLGWGQSDKPASHAYNVSSQRLDLETVVEKLNLNTINLVLHDLSGQSGIDWALDNASKISTLTLLNTYYSNMPTLKAPEAIEFYASTGVLRDLAVWGATKAQGRFKSGVNDQLSKFFSNEAARDEFLPIITNSAGAIRPAFFSATSFLWREVEARQTQLPRLSAFKQPIHIIFGADDPYLNVGVAKEFQRLFPQAKLDLIPNAGHYVQLDDARAVAQAMLKP
jgi:haloalkane dehalogenase